MSQVNFQPNTPVPGQLTDDEIGGVTPGSRSTAGAPSTPPAAIPGGSAGVDYAALGIPALAVPALGSLSLEQLVEAIGGEGRRLLTKQGLEAIKAKGDEIKELNSKKMEEIRKQLEALREKEKLSPFLKALKWVGLALAAVGAAVAVVTAVATGNGFLLAGALIGVGMLINSVTSELSDGKYSISAGVAAFAENVCGASEATAKWIGFGCEMAIVVLGAALSITGAWKVASQAAASATEAATTATEAATGGATTGAQAATAGTQAATTGAETAAKAATEVAGTVSKLQKWAAIASSAVTILSGANSVTSGALAITAAKYDYDIAKAKAELKDLEAIMLRLQAAIETEEDFVEAVVERTGDLIGKVNDIVQGNIDAQINILAGSAPSMA
jgi:hypothetical protein